MPPGRTTIPFPRSRHATRTCPNVERAPAQSGVSGHRAQGIAPDLSTAPPSISKRSSAPFRTLLRPFPSSSTVLFFSYLRPFLYAPPSRYRATQSYLSVIRIFCLLNHLVSIPCSTSKSFSLLSTVLSTAVVAAPEDPFVIRNLLTTQNT